MPCIALLSADEVGFHVIPRFSISFFHGVVNSNLPSKNEEKNSKVPASPRSSGDRLAVAIAAFGVVTRSRSSISWNDTLLSWSLLMRSMSTYKIGGNGDAV